MKNALALILVLFTLFSAISTCVQAGTGSGGTDSTPDSLDYTLEIHGRDYDGTAEVGTAGYRLD